MTSNICSGKKNPLNSRSLVPFYLYFKTLLSFGWVSMERMLINASKMEEEGGLRKKMGEERGAFAGKGC